MQSSLSQLLSKRNVSYLNPSSNFSQFQFSRSLSDGLEQAISLWKSKFSKTARGLKAARWAEDQGSLEKVRMLAFQARN